MSEDFCQGTQSTREVGRAKNDPGRFDRVCPAGVAPGARTDFNGVAGTFPALSRHDLERVQLSRRCGQQIWVRPVRTI